MEKTRSKVKVNRPRCPYCHDDIEPGGENRACYGCLTWHHSECWNYGGCVSCGGESVDPRPSPDALCVVHTPQKITPGALQDLKDLYGYDDIPCTCSPPLAEPVAKGLSKDYWDYESPTAVPSIWWVVGMFVVLVVWTIYMVTRA